MLTFANIIEKKKHNVELTNQEVKWIIDNYVNSKITDYQMASFCMATYFTDMTANETTALVKSYIESGDVYDVSQVKGFKVDKHSTGGVGDKTSLVFGPLVASYGIKVCKLSGRGLGKTGGTIDKLESFPGWKSELTNQEFVDVINNVGMSIISQSKNVVPADKKIYALRDVSGTIDSMPLITASIMSKKLIIENNGLVLDVKVGNGAFMKDVQSALDLANRMIQVGKQYNRKIAVMITDMNKPLGKAIGNAIEVKEAWETLHGKGPEDFNELVVNAVAISLLQARIFIDLDQAKADVYKKLQSGEAAHYLKDFVIAQNGDWSVLENYDQVFKCSNIIPIKAKKTGYVKYINAEDLGLLSLQLGAGRVTKEEVIDHASGIYLDKSYAQKVEKDQVVMTLYTNKPTNSDWIKLAESTFEIVDQQPSQEVIKKIISDDLK
ncbi:thymidine phosphorylase [Mycoplasma putrefaciens]|uniref:Pyrimidine-nucleoside phosphorylase n=1 Tax=Mycoplasma putrefaciens (strain ATCC 15718 / NCTC 10155 / C30 KS-1 / KS-1) TaxID=743965 RepID=A0A7U3ZS46_MYCPK|nr:thymidine phosphorylase [Mycoplasma putrefaciens]AEM68525.1 pyrimidine-nucleoside phosphorylase [Mycoplasma putrefaciens KS1]